MGTGKVGRADEMWRSADDGSAQIVQPGTGPGTIFGTRSRAVNGVGAEVGKIRLRRAGREKTGKGRQKTGHGRLHM